MKSLMQIINETYNEYCVGNVVVLTKQINKRTKKINLDLVRIIDIDKNADQIIVKDYLNSFVFDFSGNDCTNANMHLYTKEQSIELITQALNNKYLLFNGQEFLSEKNKKDLLENFKKLIKANRII